jgi:DNA-binding Lrp family transcriptional regulator
MTRPTSKDDPLLALLLLNAREPVASLARKLGVSRSTVQDRIKRLESSGIIQGYGVRLSPQTANEGLRAYVTLEVEARKALDVSNALKRLPEIETIHTVSGKFDIIARVRAAHAAAMDDLLDRIGALPGVKKTDTSVILSTRLDRSRP